MRLSVSFKTGQKVGLLFFDFFPVFQVFSTVKFKNGNVKCLNVNVKMEMLNVKCLESATKMEMLNVKCLESATKMEMLKNL